jgi:hypothetical protein
MKRRPLAARPGPTPLAGHDGVLVQWRWVEPDGYTGDGGEARLVYRRVVVADGLTDEVRADLRLLRLRGFDVPPLLGDELPPEPGATKRGVPGDYTGDDERLCNARTKRGRPCRSLALPNGRCRWHGGMSTGPRTAEGKRRAALNLLKARAALAAKRRTG